MMQYPLLPMVPMIWNYYLRIGPIVAYLVPRPMVTQSSWGAAIAYIQTTPLKYMRPPPSAGLKYIIERWPGLTDAVYACRLPGILLSGASMKKIHGCSKKKFNLPVD